MTPLPDKHVFNEQMDELVASGLGST
jgi:hypothetical protein